MPANDVEEVNPGGRPDVRADRGCRDCRPAGPYEGEDQHHEAGGRHDLADPEAQGRALSGPVEDGEELPIRRC
jgi:hypothetical protein